MRTTPPVAASVFLLATCLAVAAQQDRSADPSLEEMVRLYQDCDDTGWAGGTEVRHEPRTRDEIVAGVVRRRDLETSWRARLAEWAGGSMTPTPKRAWRYPRAGA